MATGESLRREIAAIAAKMIDGELDLTQGCRQIVLLRGSLSEPDSSDPDLLFLVAVESELDDVPLGRVRKHWAPDALAEKDMQKAEYLGVVRQDILRACSALRVRWGKLV